jgi:hypothetical protein
MKRIVGGASVAIITGIGALAATAAPALATPTHASSVTVTFAKAGKSAVRPDSGCVGSTKAVADQYAGYLEFWYTDGQTANGAAETCIGTVQGEISSIYTDGESPVAYRVRVWNDGTLLGSWYDTCCQTAANGDYIESYTIQDEFAAPTEVCQAWADDPGDYIDATCDTVN